MEEKTGPSFTMRIVAALVLALAAWFLFKAVIGVAMAVAGFIAIIVAIIAVIWAVRTLF